MEISIKYREVGKLLPYAMNARTHSESQVSDIVASIDEFGFVSPVLVDKRGEIIAGHGRVLAAKKAGIAKVPVVELPHLSERQVRALRLADNRIAQSSGWDMEKLGAELSALAEADVNLRVTGFDEQELDALLKEDMAVLPDSWQSEVLTTEGNGRTEPRKQEGELVPLTRPKTTDNEYSTFELVMLHENKVFLVDTLSSIREEHGLPKLEDALMVLVRNYTKGEKE
jgi:ParB-like chromosome segregation protein Spo0J